MLINDVGQSIQLERRLPIGLIYDGPVILVESA
jgi:hypothetical protein